MGKKEKVKVKEKGKRERKRERERRGGKREKLIFSCSLLGTCGIMSI